MTIAMLIVLLGLASTCMIGVAGEFSLKSRGHATQAMPIHDKKHKARRHHK